MTKFLNKKLFSYLSVFLFFNSSILHVKSSSSLAAWALKTNGVLISKLFMGEDFLQVKELAKSRFYKVQFFKPEASRNESKETYFHTERQ